jgi:hypothetical protein
MGAGIKNARFLEQPDKVFSDLDVDSFFRRRGAGGAASAKKVAP